MAEGSRGGIMEGGEQVAQGRAGHFRNSGFCSESGGGGGITADG